jgi:hypothetical protein
METWSPAAWVTELFLIQPLNVPALPVIKFIDMYCWLQGSGDISAVYIFLSIKVTKYFYFFQCIFSEFKASEVFCLFLSWEKGLLFVRQRIYHWTTLSALFALVSFQVTAHIFSQDWPQDSDLNQHPSTHSLQCSWDHKCRTKASLLLIWGLANLLPPSNFYPSDLCLPSNWDYRFEPLELVRGLKKHQNGWRIKNSKSPLKH